MSLPSKLERIAVISGSLRPRFVAPYFIEVEGKADLPGTVRRACAFTTAAPGWPLGQGKATHRHECQLHTDSGHLQDSSSFHWRTESKSFLGGDLEVARGYAAELPQAVAAALAAAHAPSSGPLRDVQGAAHVMCLAPEFVEVTREGGLPRIWACAHLSALGKVSAERPWTHLQTAFIRTWPERGANAYKGELEILPVNMLHSMNSFHSQSQRNLVTWSAATFGEAVAAFRNLINTPIPSTDHQRRS
jgi:hypothetical protein